MTALAVNPSGNKLAVHASDTTQSVVDPNNSNRRRYYGSLYSFLFVVSTKDGDLASKVMKITHGDSVDSYAYQVWSSGMFISSDDKIYFALN